VCRQHAVGIVPLTLGLKLDPLEMQAPQLFGFGVGDFALHPEKTALVIVCHAHAIAHFARIQAQNPRQQLRRHAHIRHAQWIYEHRFHRHAHSKGLARAVEDRTPRRGDLDFQLLLLPRDTRILSMMYHLEGNQLGEYQSEPYECSTCNPSQTSGVRQRARDRHLPVQHRWFYHHPMDRHVTARSYLWRYSASDPSARGSKWTT